MENTNQDLLAKSYNNKTKKQKRYRGLKKDSTNYKVFSVIAYLLSKAARTAGEDIKDLLDLFAEYSATSIAQKFHGTYYADLEEHAPTGKEMREAAINKAIKELESLDYIKIKSNKRGKVKLKISFTKKGAREYLRYKINRKKKKKWDKKWRLIIFDIFEDHKKIRDLLRARLKWLGFKELQKSVWIFPYDVEREVENMLDVCDVNIIGDVRFLTVEKMNDNEDLKREFGLLRS